METVEYEVGRDGHKDLVRFLEEQASFPSDPLPVFYEPIVRTKPEKIRVGSGSRIDSFVKLEGGEGLEIGRYVHIASFAHVGIGGGTTFVEDFAAVASGGKIISGSNQVSAITMSACAPEELQKVRKSVTRISKYACVLTNATVLPGVTLGEGAVLGAGAVATKNIPPWEIWIGTPARLAQYRLVNGICPFHKGDRYGRDYPGAFQYCPHCAFEIAKSGGKWKPSR
jgi:acetyltransferase-like isoleucine patch superfamily enzyme